MRVELLVMVMNCGTHACRSLFSYHVAFSTGFCIVVADDCVNCVIVDFLLSGF